MQFAIILMVHSALVGETKAAAKVLLQKECVLFVCSSTGDLTPVLCLISSLPKVLSCESYRCVKSCQTGFQQRCVPQVYPCIRCSKRQKCREFPFFRRSDCLPQQAFWASEKIGTEGVINLPGDHTNYCTHLTTPAKCFQVRPQWIRHTQWIVETECASSCALHALAAKFHKNSGKWNLAPKSYLSLRASLCE